MGTHLSQKCNNNLTNGLFKSKHQEDKEIAFLRCSSLVQDVSISLFLLGIKIRHSSKNADLIEKGGINKKLKIIFFCRQSGTNVYDCLVPDCHRL